LKVRRDERRKGEKKSQRTDEPELGGELHAALLHHLVGLGLVLEVGEK
jgi:hypothetical protein